VEADIDVLRSAGVDVVPLIEDSDDIPSLGLGGKLGVASGPVFNPAGVGRMRRMLATHRPDVVHVHNVFPLLFPLGRTRCARRRASRSCRTVHNFRQDCVAGTYFRDGEICTDCVGRRIATPALKHGCYEVPVADAPHGRRRALHRSTWRSIDRFLVLNRLPRPAPRSARRAV